ncbi:TonB family protein [Granulicella sp. WH15]|uniref:energy transducer TonB n=1 Tax=Granulicella sp. WH15 TaxID=2602070 RepID=UPI0013672B9F|nr:energy transducer TonB [Granulicella sp. WH15]QHN02143.1 TonB family protein [Granulicella sp. WH15]
MVPNLFGTNAISDGRTYSVLLIDDNKNKIPTGTELFVQGTISNLSWTRDNTCDWTLINGRASIQHGDNPLLYCRFSVALTEKRVDGEDMWPAAALVCDVTPRELKEVLRLYHHGDTVQAHGTYAASLDFEAVSNSLGRFGAPLLEDCTFASPTKHVVRTAEEAKSAVADNWGDATTMRALQKPTAKNEASASQIYSLMDKGYREHPGPQPGADNAFERPANESPARPQAAAAAAAAAAAKPVATAWVQPPRLLVKVDPVYPEGARAKGIAGMVGVGFTIDPQGHPVDLRVVKSVCPSLDLAALDAVSKYRFAPPADSGPHNMQVGITFR